MKKFKKVVAMCLTAVMAISVMSIGAMAATGDNSGIVEPLSKSSYTLNDSDGTQKFIHQVTAAEPYLKVWCENTSSSVYTIQVINPSGSRIALDTVDAYGGQATIFGPGALTAGYYTVIVSSKDGYALSGSLAIRTASNETELLNLKDDNMLK